LHDNPLTSERTTEVADKMFGMTSQSKNKKKIDTSATKQR